MALSRDGNGWLPGALKAVIAASLIGKDEDRDQLGDGGRQNAIRQAGWPPRGGGELLLGGVGESLCASYRDYH